MTRYIDDLKYQIERILGWEPSSHWQVRDFAHLSELVYTHTQRHVDARELQVFWQTSTEPSPGFLNTLSCFADYTDWDDFCTRNFYGTVETDEETEILHAPMWEIPIRWVIVLCWFSVIASVIVAALLLWKR